MIRFGIFLRSLLSSDSQRREQQLKDEIPIAIERFRHLVSIAGPDAAPGIWLRDLALRASTIRAARVQFMRLGGRRSAQDSSLWALAKSNEHHWWADRAAYLAGLQVEQIVGGPPSIPGLWDEEILDFISRYPALDREGEDA